MKKTVVITDAATGDIEEQFDYIRVLKMQPLNAARWIRGLYAAIDALGDFAGYSRAPESDFLHVELRQKIYKSHRIIYSLDDAQNQVVIHYVRHGARRPVGDPTEGTNKD